MNAFLASSIHSEITAQGLAGAIAQWLRRRLEERQRRQQERKAIEHLRKLEPYLLRDAGIAADPLHAVSASIVELHPGYSLFR